MPDESTTRDPVERVRRGVDALNRRDLDEFLSAWAPDAVLDTGGMMGTFEGVAAIRGFLEDWFTSYQQLWIEQEEVLNLGNGVVFAVVLQEARPAGTAAHVRQREGCVYVWVGGLITRLTASDLDEARAAAERLAKERE